MKEIKGIIPIVAAPFTDEGAFDEDSFQNMLRHLLQTGVHGLTLFGIATEFYKLTDAERERMKTIFLSETADHPTVTSIVSVTDHAKDVAVKRAKELENSGADALMLLPPYFLSPSLEAIVEHIEAVASAVTIPIVVQYAPYQTGVSIPADVFVNIKARYDNVQFVKVETQPPGKYVSELLRGSNGTLRSLVGYAGIQMPDVLKRGGAGVQPGCSFSEVYVHLYRLFEEKKEDEFMELFEKLLPYISYWMQTSELIIRAEKKILQKRGIIASDYCRAPAYSLDDIEIEMIDRFITQFQPFLEEKKTSSKLERY